MSKTPSDSRVDDGWVDEQSSQLRDQGYKIIRFGEQKLVYVGQVNYDNKPDGIGFMFLPSGDLHECEFEKGRAHGKGVYYTSKGVEMRGTWNRNMRVGEFAVLDNKGAHWIERYNDEGKRAARKKVREEKPNPDFKEGGDEPETIQVEVEKDEPARKCWNCNHFARARNNHAWACRAHNGRFTEDSTYRGDGPRPGVWSCCGRTERSEPGCAFREHNFMDD
eukprot:m.10791 g.10791  ORF g.10791 m.10791 type:complete len:221 (-) comp3726_c0_seq3:1057-1719(-)